MAREVNLPLSSRLSATPLLQDPGTNDYYYGVWGKIEFPVDTNDKVHVVTQQDLINWPQLAHRRYGDFKKMWVIWSANGITDPFNVEVGTTINLPAVTAVESVLANITKDAE